jgi:hypothetical protein
VAGQVQVRGWWCSCDACAERASSLLCVTLWPCVTARRAAHTHTHTHTPPPPPPPPPAPVHHGMPRTPHTPPQVAAGAADWRAPGVPPPGAEPPGQL